MITRIPMKTNAPGGVPSNGAASAIQWQPLTRAVVLHRPLIWLNLVCLDAPLVAFVWQALFARALGVHLNAAERVALFLTAWLVYLADRFVDTMSLEHNAPASLRQQFCRRWRAAWMPMLGIVAAADIWLIWHLDPKIIQAGTVVGIVSVVYLTLNSLGKLGRIAPLKEGIIGALFATGTVLVPWVSACSLTAEMVSAAVAFAAVCILNCISIGSWEYKLDRVQGKKSLATTCPDLVKQVWLLSIVVGVGASLLVARGGSLTLIFSSLALSSFLLAALDLLPDSVPCDTRTALADMVLLTPVVSLLLHL